MTEKYEVAERLRAQLALGAALGLSAMASSDTIDMRLRQWRSERLSRTHRDLLETPRYRDAAIYFLSELYGPADLTSGTRKSSG
jgi:hypothetical protein